MRSLLSIRDLSPAELWALSSPNLDAHVPPPLRGIAACWFQQGSLRTLSSFAAAAAALGLSPISLNPYFDTYREACDFYDEVAQLGQISSCVILRTPDPLVEPALRRVTAPIINAGDGSNEHPTQALLDLAVLRKAGLTFASPRQRVVVMGNLKAHRSSHSLALALTRAQVGMTLLSPPGFEMPVQYYEGNSNTQVVSTEDAPVVDDVLRQADFIYQTPLRYWTNPDNETTQGYALNLERAIRLLPSNAKILHPFPRHGELNRDLDGSTYDAYQAQTRMGPLIRRRIIQWCLRPESLMDTAGLQAHQSHLARA